MGSRTTKLSVRSYLVVDRSSIVGLRSEKKFRRGVVVVVSQTERKISSRSPRAIIYPPVHLALSAAPPRSSARRSPFFFF